MRLPPLCLTPVCFKNIKRTKKDNKKVLSVYKSPNVSSINSDYRREICVINDAIKKNFSILSLFSLCLLCKTFCVSVGFRLSNNWATMFNIKVNCNSFSFIDIITVYYDSFFISRYPHRKKEDINYDGKEIVIGNDQWTVIKLLVPLILISQFIIKSNDLLSNEHFFLWETCIVWKITPKIATKKKYCPTAAKCFWRYCWKEKVSCLTKLSVMRR